MLSALAIAMTGAWGTEPVAALSCNGGDAHFAGTSDTHTNAVRGGSAKIEFVNEELCTTTGAASFSSYWSAVVGFHPDDTLGFNIFQVGVDECRNTACPSGVPTNTPYYFWAYGRMQSAACGVAVVPSPHLAPKGNAGSGLLTYTVIRENVPGQGLTYKAKISGQTQAHFPEATLLTCWGGVDAVQIFNEVLDDNDQSGGPNSNRQNFEAPQWHNGASWAPITRAAGSTCDFVDASTQRCQWASDGSDKWWSWDTRWP